MSELHLHDFGIFLELEPDEEEKQLLENNIQVAIAQNNIHLEDAIDIRMIKNVKLANQLLKLRRKKKAQEDMEKNQANIQAQAQANAQAQQVAAQAESQKQQIAAESKVQIAQAQSQFDIQKMEKEAAIKKELMELEFNFNMQLRNAEVENVKQREKQKEDRKDERTKIQASQQSELIDQRKNNLPPKSFESGGNDIMSGDFDLGAFDPK